MLRDMATERETVHAPYQHASLKLRIIDNSKMSQLSIVVRNWGGRSSPCECGMISYEGLSASGMIAESERNTFTSERWGSAPVPFPNRRTFRNVDLKIHGQLPRG